MNSNLANLKGIQSSRTGHPQDKPDEKTVDIFINFMKS
jgi:hypothetical protein